MRIIAIKTLKEYWKEYPKSEQSIKAWIKETEQSAWKSPQALKMKFRNASIINNKRVIFNINGNNYRLIVDVEYRLQIVFIVWFGTYDEYNLINAKNIDYVKTNKKQ